MNVNDKINNNQGASFPNGGKTRLEGQIEALKTQESQISQQLKLWESKLKKANNLANCLEAVDKFASKLLTEAVESENSREQALIRNQVEFSLKFEAGVEAFAKLVLKSVEAKVKSLENDCSFSSKKN